MDDLSTRDEEQAREREREQEKGRKKEQDLQRERKLAEEKGRKLGKEEERKRKQGTGGFGTGIKIIIAVIVLALIVIAAAFLTLSISVTNASPGAPLPFTTNYGVSFPEGQTVTIGNTHITVLSYQNEIISDIDGDRQKLVVGQERTISERRAVITTLGAVTLMDTNFQINLVYKGNRDNRAYFDMAVHSSEQVPDILISQLLPPEIDARPA
jgi:pyruvate/2-oxoglutarate dehydrogenase complex dihydrolipoamide acyltransferase (E2) component